MKGVERFDSMVCKNYYYRSTRQSPYPICRDSSVKKYRVVFHSNSRIQPSHEDHDGGHVNPLHLPANRRTRRLYPPRISRLARHLQRSNPNRSRFHFAVYAVAPTGRRAIRERFNIIRHVAESRPDNSAARLFPPNQGKGAFINSKSNCSAS